MHAVEETKIERLIEHQAEGKYVREWIGRPKMAREKKATYQGKAMTMARTDKQDARDNVNKEGTQDLCLVS